MSLEPPSLEKRKGIWSSVQSHWKIRLSVGLLMFILAFIGLIVTEIKQDGGWDYWRFVSVFFALLSLGLTFYLRKHRLKESVSTIWHEVLHWIGLIFAIFLVSVFVELGIFSRFAASLQVLLLLALATFLAGVYIESTFLFVGILLGGFAWGLSVVSLYLYTIVMPFAIVLFGIFLWFVKRKSHSSHTKD